MPWRRGLAPHRRIRGPVPGEGGMHEQDVGSPGRAAHMILGHFARYALLSLALATCTEPAPEIAPVILPPSPKFQQRAAAGDAIAQFALADHCRARQYTRKVL